MVHNRPVSDAYRSIELLRVDATRWTPGSDVAATEEPLQISLNDRPFAVTMRTPGADLDLAAGFLLSEGVVTGPHDLADVEQADYAFRVDDLRKTGAKIRFLSLEPLLGPLEDLDLAGIHWVIVGGESGPGARPLQEGWVTGIRDQCFSAGVPFFFKQWGGVFKSRNGRTLQGRTWDGMPERRQDQADGRVVLATV